jgi:sensor histidine kinase YesM
MREHMRSIVLTISVSGFLGIIFFAYLHYSELGTIPLFSENYYAYMLAFAMAVVTGIAARVTHQFLDRLLPWKSMFASRFIFGYAAEVSCMLLVIYSLSILIINLSDESVFWKGFTVNDEDLTRKLFILVLVAAFIYTVIYSILYSYKQYAVTQIELIQNERKQLELQFEALKSQLSPHYLFNSLNTISSLLYNDPKTAEQFIRRLAVTYQYILSNQHKKQVTVLNEIEFVQSYYYLLRIRFQQALTLEVNLPKSVLNSLIPPLTLQLLVENAVKHNTLSPQKPLFIYISAVDNTLLKITNTKNESAQSAASFKIGLENIRMRYRFFTDKKVEIKDDDKFTVTLPVLKNTASETAVAPA